MRPSFPNQFRRKDFSPDQLPGLAAWYDVSAFLNNGNIFPNSETFDSAAVTKTALNAFGAVDTGAAGAGSFANTTRTLDPLGNNAADFIQVDATTGEHFARVGSTVFSGNYIFSCYVKQSGAFTATHLHMVDSTTFERVRSSFDISTGIVGPGSAAGSFTFVSAAIQALPNGWYKCSVTFSTSISASVNFRVYTASTTASASSVGDNTSGLFVWGAHVRREEWEDRYIRSGDNLIFPNAQADATNAVVSIRDLSGNSLRDLFQGTAANMPTLVPASLADKPTLLFNGTTHFLKSSSFPLVQPVTFYAVLAQESWTVNDVLLDGFAVSCVLRQNVATPGLILAGSLLGPSITNFPVGVPGVLSGTFNAASSLLQSGILSPALGNMGTGTMNGVTLGSRAGSVGFSNIRVAEIMFYSEAHDAATRLKVQQYLAAKWDLPL